MNIMNITSINPVFSTQVDVPVLATGETIKISPISSMQEKAMLESGMILEDNFDSICDIYKIPKHLPEVIKLGLLLKIREISNGSECQLKYKCPNCKRPTESQIVLENVFDFSLYQQLEKKFDIKFKSDLYQTLEKIGGITKVTFTDLPKLIENFDELSKDVTKLTDLSDILKDVKLRLPKLRSDLSCRCFACMYELPVKLTREFCLEALSEHSITSMYEMYHALVLNGFTKHDIDGMLPFEREVQYGLIQRHNESANKQNNGATK